MATSTPNLNLILPDYSDKADISVLNDNFQKIDEYCANGGVSNEELQDAVKAANAWANATASAESVSANNEADVKLTGTEDSRNLHFSIPRGQPGVLISETEPTDPNVKVWIKPDGEPNELEQLKSDVSSLKDQIVDEVSMALPSLIYGKAKVEDLNGTIYTGTQNVAQLFRFPDADVEYGGVKFTVRDGVVTLNGTATAAFYFSLNAGAVVQVGDLMQKAYTLPSREYVMTGHYEFETGTAPTLNMRNIAGGNIGTLSFNSDGLRFNYSENCGHIYLYIVQGATYNNASILVGLFPFTEGYSTFKSQKSSIRTVTENGETVFSGYTWVDGEVSVSAVINKIESAKCAIQYSKTLEPASYSEEQIDVYVPTAMGFVRYELTHSVYDGINADTWRINRVWACDNAKNVRFPITNYGEIEMAVKIDGRDDFIGGSMHGDEKYKSLVVLIDGVRVSDLNGLDMTNCDEVRMFEVTDMFDPADHSTLVGTHGREYVFTTDGLILNQNVVWNGAYTLNDSYLPMFPAYRGNDTASALQITDTYIDSASYTPYDISVGGMDTVPFQYKKHADKVSMFSDKSGVCCTIEILKTFEGDGGGYTFIQNTPNQYNKYYSLVCGYDKLHTTKAGERWDVSSRIHVSVAAGTDVS